MEVETETSEDPFSGEDHEEDPFGEDNNDPFGESNPFGEGEGNSDPFGADPFG